MNDQKQENLITYFMQLQQKEQRGIDLLKRCSSRLDECQEKQTIINILKNKEKHQKIINEIINIIKFK